MGEEDEENTMTPQEAFFHAAATGDVAAITSLLASRHKTGLDINAKDEGGYTALCRGISEGYLGIIYPLLEANVFIGDAMLRAVDADFHEAVRVLLEYANDRPESERLEIIDCHCESNDIHPDITPIIRAAQLNSFAIVKMLLEADLTIPEVSTNAFESGDVDDLQRSVGTLEIYGGLASEAYVCLASTDPIDRAFTLCGTMRAVSDIEVEFKMRYLELADKMERLAADLVSFARDSEEITTVLTYHEITGDDGSAEAPRHLGTLPKVTRAIQYEQRQFVAHPNTQQAVSAQFYRHLSNMRDMPAILNLLAFIGIILAYPFLSLLYKTGMSKKIHQLVRTPYVKFVMQVGSDLSLIVLLPLVDPSSHMGDRMLSPGDSALNLILLLFVIGLGWRQVYLLYMKGVKKVMGSFSNSRDVLITILLMAYFGLTAASLIMRSACPEILPKTIRHAPNSSWLDAESQSLFSNFSSNIKDFTRTKLDELVVSLSEPVNTGEVGTLIEKLLNCVNSSSGVSPVSSPDPTPPDVASQCTGEHVELRDWNDPNLIANGLFGIVVVLTFTRIVPFLIANEFVGPLVISLGDMIIRTSSFFLFLVTVIISFSASLTFNYSVYSNDVDARCEANNELPFCNNSLSYRTLGDSMMSLYWSLFGLVSISDLSVAGTTQVTIGAGTLLYAFFYIFAVLVLLNALIAVMSNVFNKVEENADVEWKFSRTSLWMSFLDDTVTVPPPFNLMPNFGHLTRELKVLWQRCCKRDPSRRVNPNSAVVELGELPKRKRTYKKVDLGNYQRIMKRLVERFIAERTAQEASAQGDITVADLRNLRNDIVALRYDTFKQLCQVNEELDATRRQSSTINTQSSQANDVFQKTEKIEEEIDAYGSRLAEVQSELSQKLEILPAIEELMQRLAEMEKSSGITGMLGHSVREMVTYYEDVKDKIAASKAEAKDKLSKEGKQSALTRTEGLTLTLENEDDEE
ncbi:short transient receptor potential channel 4-like [Diadema setosum]|uniref:short transient receptor potential channel 4-like n=1 Tax=Diadema setosum TaxID=31175 RepID=UPI003B3B0FB5